MLRLRPLAELGGFTAYGHPEWTTQPGLDPASSAGKRRYPFMFLSEIMASHAFCSSMVPVTLRDFQAPVVALP